MSTDRTFALVGELRVDLLDLFESTDAVDLLLTAPGLLPAPPRGTAPLARAPHRRLSVEQAFAHRRALLEFFAAQVDRLPQLPAEADKLRAWLARIRAGSARFKHLETRPLFTRLVSSMDGTAVMAGPFTNPMAEAADREINVELRGSEHVRARDWAAARLAEATDISAEVAAILEQCWAGDLLDPYDLYYRVLAEYFGATLEGMDSEADDNPMLEVMTSFQAEAYNYAKGVLRRYGGVFLSDVVGLGKTFIALALLKYLQDRYGEHAVVVAPPAVLPAWDQLAAEFRIELRTLSHGKLDELDRFEDREILVIDESHNFRNPDTQRYGRIQSWLRPNGDASDRRVILISATPQNNRPSDVLNQLRLFPDTYTRLPHPGESLEDYFRSVDVGQESLSALLQHVVVRRTRRFIQRAYPDAKLRVKVGPGQFEERPLRFPTRISGPEQALRYSIEEAYGGGLYDSLIEMLGDMAYPLYGIGGYLKPEHQGDERFTGVNRAGRALRGLIKVLLLKRLESSLDAFRISLRRLAQRLEEALSLLADGKVRVKVGRATNGGDDAEVDVVDLERLESTSWFDTARLEADLWSDLDLIESRLDRLEALDSSSDAKLARLKTYLQNRPPTEHRTIVFTQFADTAEYLAAALGDAHGRTVRVTGSSGGALKIARRFAPLGNRVTVPDEEQIDLLISTDALSEGVNLQDADTLINYDLHWNPVRLIQRAGRIDRIGSPNDEIHVASFLPERGLEARLGLEAVLRHRIDEFLKVFGEDSRVLPDLGETLDEIEAIEAYTGRALDRADEDDDVDALGRHAERILSLRREDPERYDRILTLRPGRRAVSAAARAPVIGTRLGWFWAFWRARDGDLTRVDDLVGLELFHRHAQDGGVEPDAEIGQALGQLGERVEVARGRFAPLAEQVREQRSQPRLDPTEEWVRASLERYRSVCRESRKPLVQDMIDWVLAGQHKVQLRRRARLWRREKVEPESVFHEMKWLLRRFPVQDEDLGEPLVVGSAVGVGWGRAPSTDGRERGEPSEPRLQAEEEARESVGTCRNHPDSPVVDLGEHWGCTEEDCPSAYPKTYRGRTMSADEISVMLERGATPILDGFVSNKGKSFSGSLYLRPDGRIGFLNARGVK